LVAFTHDPKRQERKNANEYVLEARLLKAIEDLGSQRVASRQELLSSIAKQADEFDTKMWLLTLEGKGYIQRTESGYILTVKGRQKLQNKI
jgi:hypothetical protein